MGVAIARHILRPEGRLIPVDYPDQGTALADVRQGQIAAVIIIPEHYSRDVLRRRHPRLALISDNTDRFVSGAVGASLTQLVAAVNAPRVPARDVRRLVLDQVELYPFISYMKYLLPGVVTLSIFFTAMVGGGIIYLDDKSRGVHEGYLVTPITKMELILGFVTSGVIKAIAAGTVVLVIGSYLSGVTGLFEPARLLSLLGLTAVTAVALIAMMFLLVARVDDPLTPRAAFGVLNMLLFFPSGAIYPIAAFPPWMQVIARVDPFAYAVHGYRTLLLTQAGMGGVYRDIAVLAGFSLVALAGAGFLFRRTL